MSCRVTCRSVAVPAADARPGTGGCWRSWSRSCCGLRGLRRVPPLRITLDPDVRARPGSGTGTRRAAPRARRRASRACRRSRPTCLVQDVDDVPGRHVAGLQLLNGAGPDRLAGVVDGGQDPQAAAGQGQGAGRPAAKPGQSAGRRRAGRSARPGAGRRQLGCSPGSRSRGGSQSIAWIQRADSPRRPWPPAGGLRRGAGRLRARRIRPPEVQPEQLVTGDRGDRQVQRGLAAGPAIRLACLRHGRHTVPFSGRSRRQVEQVPAGCVSLKLRQALQSRSVSRPQAMQCPQLLSRDARGRDLAAGAPRAGHTGGAERPGRRRITPPAPPAAAAEEAGPGCRLAGPCPARGPAGRQARTPAPRR